MGKKSRKKPQDPVFQTVKKLRGKLWLDGILKCLSNGLLASGIGAIGIALAVHGITLVQAPQKIAWLMVFCIITGLVFGLLRRPGLHIAAEAGDGLGLSDRLTTYIEYADRDSPVLEAFREDTREALLVFQPLNRYRVTPGGKKLLMAFLLLLVAGVILFIPSAGTKAAAQKQEINAALQEEARHLAQFREEARQEAAEAPEEERLLQQNQAFELLKHLEEKLAESLDYDESATQVGEAQKELTALQENRTAEALKGLAGVFDGLGAGSADLQKALQKGVAEAGVRAAQNQVFTREEQARILANAEALTRNKGGENNTLPDEALEMIKTAAGEGTLNGPKLAQALQKAAQSGKQTKFEAEAEVRLQQLKERLLTKGQQGFKSFGQEQQSRLFTEGDNEGRQQGEPGEGAPSALAQGEKGNMPAHNPYAKGGQGDFGGSPEPGENRTGQLAKKAGTNPTESKDGKTVEVQGSWQADQGQIRDQQTDKALEVQGEFKDRGTLTREFQETGMDYVNKYNIPGDEKPLVLEYFNRLKGVIE